MRVLHVISDLDPVGGGPPQALAGLASAQARAGCRVTVVTTLLARADQELVEELHDADVAVDVLMPARGKLRSHPRLRGLLARRAAEADIVHIHALWEDAQHLAARHAFRLRKPYVIRPCGMLDPYSLRYNGTLKRLYMAVRLRRNINRAAALHFTSETEHLLTKPLGFRTPPIVEPNGLDLSEFASLPEPGTFRRRHPAVGDRRMLLFLGRLHPKKGLDLLLPAVAARAPADVVLVVAGSGSDAYTRQLHELAAAQGIADRVLFTGMLRGPDRVAALADADLFVLPSYQENFGNAVVEALAAGTPVLVSDQVNIHEQLATAGVGGVCPVTIAGLGEALHRWLSDDALRAAAAERARPFVWSHFDWACIAERWAGHYERLVSSALAPAPAPAFGSAPGSEPAAQQR